MFQTLAYFSTVFYRRFTAYTTQRLQELGLHFGSLFPVIYVGKHPGCTQAELTANLGLDWGHSQRTVARLVEDGFLTREKSGRAFRLGLSEKGRQAFAVSHQVFFDWDQAALAPLTREERTQLLSLLAKAAQKEADQPCMTSSAVPSTTAD